MRVLVTGGRGLLGAAVVQELRRCGHAVSVLQRSAAGHGPDVPETLGDISDPAAVARAMAGQEGVVHLAARVSMIGAWQEFEQVNVGGTRIVLRAAVDAGATRFVHISSPSVAHAGEPLVGAGATPADPTAARGAYARSKAMAEQLALGPDAAGLDVVVVRPHLVWGPGDTQLIGRIAERARAGRLVLVDDGAALIDSTYVDNAASAIAAALHRCHRPEVRGRAFVVSNGQPRTVAELVSRIAIASGGHVPTRHLPYPAARALGSLVERVWERTARPDEPPLTAFLAEQLATAHWFDQRDTRSALDWLPHVGIEEGLRRLAASFASATA